MKAYSRFIVLLGIAGTCVGSVFAQADPADLQKIANEGKKNNQIMSTMRELTKGIGARLTGSPRLFRAYHWAMDKFKSYGLKNVHLEKWGEYPQWDRGARQSLKMTEPFESPMVFTTNAWSNGTSGPLRGEAVAAPKTAAEVTANKDAYKGKFIVQPASTGGGRGGGGAAPNAELARALDEAGIAGRISGSNREEMMTSGSPFLQGRTGEMKSYKNHPGSLQIMVRKSDHDRILRQFTLGRKVTIEADIENIWYPTPTGNYNVVADYVGSEKPDEMVIVSGHFDSWNGPGSEGASDNGTGSCAAIEAARILSAAKVKPKRTIRFVLWSGEEQGLLGSTQYVKDHAAELPKISCVLVDDGGSNYQGGYQGIETQVPMLTAAIQKSIETFPDMPQKVTATANGRMPRGGGSDHSSFNAVGVPGFFTIETGRQVYGHVWHTQFDTLENVIPEYMVQSSANHALVSFFLACAPTLLPREARSAAGTPQATTDHDHDH